MNATEKTTTPMKIIRKPAKGSRTVFKTDNTEEDFVFFLADGNIDYVCGNPGCGKVLCKNVRPGQISNVVFRCPKCNKYNEIM